eukprot:TRINITY_DN31451_c0_g1_i3.p1 TRINITY_DN31451_c0_g1~~TRINITY_DN31451_c0_g1_i3.p1  ORF type:complete len:804 (+),score=52.09 TRINITY_DN31451_c0_g1_i3:102-2513(+)
MQLMTNLSRSGVDLIIATSFSFEGIVFDAAQRFPETDFAHFPGQGPGPPNLFFGSIRAEQSMYAAAIVAGANTQTRRIGFVAPMRIAGVMLGLSMLYLGAQKGAGGALNGTHIEHRVDVLVVWIHTFASTDLELEAAKRLHALGCDVLMHNADHHVINGYAKEHGLLSVGQFNDVRHTLGESVITSTTLNFSPLFYEVSMLSYNKKLRAPDTDRTPDWYGYNRGGPVAHEPSFAASADSVRLFNSVVDDMKAGRFDPVCLPLIREGEVTNKGECLTPAEVRHFSFVVDGPVEVEDKLVLPGEMCGNGTYHTVEIDEAKSKYEVTCHECQPGDYSVVTSLRLGNTACLPCPPGFYSNGAAAVCSECPQGFYSAEGSTVCIPCPEGQTNTGNANAACLVDVPQTDYTLLYIFASLSGALIFVAGPLVVRKVIRDRRELNALHSEKTVAQKCAESIADMCLEEVGYIRDIEHPSDIVRAFITIVDNMTEYRRFLPLTLLAERDPNNALPCDTQEAVDRQGPVAGLASPSLGSAWSEIARSESSGTTAPPLPRRLANTRVGVSRLDITFLVVNIVGFMELFENLPDAIQLHSAVAEGLLQVFDQTHGTSESFSGDRFITTYNSVRRLSHHRTCGCRALLLLPTVEQKLGIRLSVSASSSVVRAGTVGCSQMRRFSFFGSLVPWAFALERYCKHVEAPNLVDASLLLSEFEFWLVDSVSFAKHSETLIPVFVITKELRADAQDWMHLVVPEGSSLQWNEWAGHVIEGRWHFAEAEGPRGFESQRSPYYCKILEAYNVREFIPANIEHH